MEITFHFYKLYIMSTKVLVYTRRDETGRVRYYEEPPLLLLRYEFEMEQDRDDIYEEIDDSD